MDIITNLLKYQEVDERLLQIEDVLRSSEAYKKCAQALKFLKSADENRTQFEEHSNALISSFNEKTKELEHLLEEKQEISTDSDTDEKQVAFLIKKASELSKRLSALEAEIANLETEIKKLLSAYSSFLKKGKEYSDQLKEFKAPYDELVKKTNADKQEVLAELGKLESKIPEKYVKIYKEKRKDGKGKIVCQVLNDVCTGCNTELVTIEKEKLNKEKIIECPNCHKLIYLA